jgi:hypothetical protein
MFQVPHDNGFARLRCRECRLPCRSCHKVHDFWPKQSSCGTCPLLLALAGGGLVSARQPARAAPAACLVLPIAAGACRPSACVSPPQRGRGLALGHRWVPVPRAQGVHSRLYCGKIAFEFLIRNALIPSYAYCAPVFSAYLLRLFSSLTIPISGSEVNAPLPPH